MISRKGHMKRIVGVLLMVLAGIIPAFGQIVWHPDGESGYQLALQSSVQSGAIGIGAAAGYSLWGILDLNCSGEEFFLSDKLSDASVSAQQLQPSATFIGFGGSPLSVVAHVAYTIERYHSSAFNAQPNMLNGNYFSSFYGFEFHARLSPSVTSEPIFGIGFIEAAPNAINGYDTPLSSPEARTPVFFSFPMFFQNSVQQYLTVVPTIRYFPGEAIEPDQLELYVTVGYFFSTSSGH